MIQQLRTTSYILLPQLAFPTHMGCAQSTRPSMESRLEKMKLESGYAYIPPRRSTKQESRNGRGGGGGGEMGVADVGERGDLGNKEEEFELVDGWPKWLVDNIPREVLKDIVPKSADSYVKIDKIGQGTYSNVYKARDKQTGKVVALKKVRFDTSEAESIKFMAREIVILQKLDHPNIVKLRGLATSRMQYSLYLVFDYFHSDLSRILSRPDEILSEPQVKCYMQQLLSGLEHCHERGVLHRDIKGSNLLIDKNGKLTIADFGLASIFSSERRRPLTSRVVTLWYRAPELLLGSTDYGIGIDLWSAGCLMAEMISGRPILPGRTEIEQVHRIFKLCGTPPEDYYKTYKVSTSLRPPQTYKPSLGEMFKYFPPSSLGMLRILLALDPAHRGSATSALQNQFFLSSPLACDLSGLPVILVEDDDDVPISDIKRKQRTRRRSQSRMERRKKKLDSDKPKEDLQKSPHKMILGSPKATVKQDIPRLHHPSPVAPGLFSSTEAHPNANRNIKNMPSAASFNRLDLAQRSASSREFRSTSRNSAAS